MIMLQNVIRNIYICLIATNIIAYKKLFWKYKWTKFIQTFKFIILSFFAKKLIENL